MREVQWMQWFAEAGPADEAARTGDTAPDAGEQEDFAALIRGRYKADFDARVQKILDGRLRGLRQENARLRQEREQRQEQAQLTDPGAGQEELGEGAPRPAAAGQHGIQPGMAGGQPRSFGLRQPIAAPHQAFEP